MSSRVLTLVLVVGLAGSVVTLFPLLGTLHLPGNQQGYEPIQPIAFSHRLHAGELQIACLYCHFGAEQSRYAGIPAASVCMNCHKFITAPLGAVRSEEELAKQQGRKPQRIISPELEKLYEALALGANLQRDPHRTPRPINWIKVDNLPDFVEFDHRPHVAAGVACQQCHGSVETMERVAQVEPFTMGWCVNCHRQANQTGVNGKQVYASIDCDRCHY